MSDDSEKGPQIIDAHQELISHIEQGAGRIRILSILTLIVAAFLAVSYASQLALPLFGTRSETVDLADPVLVGTEMVALALTIAWLYVGVRDLMFSTRMRREIGKARAKEREIAERIS